MTGPLAVCVSDELVRVRWLLQVFVCGRAAVQAELSETVQLNKFLIELNPVRIYFPLFW